MKIKYHNNLKALLLGICNQSKIISMFFCLSLITVSSCKKFVEVDAPKTQLVTKTVYQNNETANAAMLSVYASLISSPSPSYLISYYTALSGDELKNYSNRITFQQLYTNTLNSTGAPTNTLWTTFYNYIYQANAVYEGCSTSTSLKPDVKKQLMAEATFIRAFAHFYLTNLFGDIPLVKSTDYTINSRLSRLPVSVVYDQIIADLIYAISNLNENYVDATGIVSIEKRVRPNKYAAIALLARVYLYTKQYAKAEEQATLVIGRIGQYKLENLTSVYLTTSKEAIWQLMIVQPNVEGINTPEGNNFILTQIPKTSGSTISASLFNSFTDDDLRKINWIASFTDNSVNPAVNYYYPFKYKVKNSTVITEQSTIFRLAEQYLIRAESRAQQGNISGAIEDVDVIRSRAGLAKINDTNPGISKGDLLIAIEQERRHELFTEWGHRWLDLKRTDKINAVMSVEAGNKGSQWNAYQQLYPIPQTEITNNPNIKQNPGYN